MHRDLDGCQEFLATMEGVVRCIAVIGVAIISYVGEWENAVYIKGTVIPQIVQVGQDVILHCQVGSCPSSSLQVHLYKWEGSKNQTLYIHSSTEQHSIQESRLAENNTHNGYYENGYLEVTLLQVQLANSGQYVCSMMCNDVYKEDIMEVTVEEVPGQSAEIWQFYSFGFGVASLAFLFILAYWHTSRKLEQCEAEREQLKIDKEELQRDNEHLKIENEKLKGEMKARREQYEAEREQLKIDKEILAARLHKDEVILDSRTAHPKLKVSEDGKSVWNTGDVSKVSDCEERFDSRTFILAKHGFSEGKHYWEVEIGQKKTWDLGVASATICRKGEITLSPENGYWVIGCDDGRDYWARTEQWTRLKVNGKLTKLGIFLDKSAGILSFYDVCSQRKLHTYKTLGDGELYPFFYIGCVTKQPLKIVECLK